MTVVVTLVVCMENSLFYNAKIGNCYKKIGLYIHVISTAVTQCFYIITSKYVCMYNTAFP